MSLELKSIPDSDLDAYFDMLNDASLAVNTGSIPHPISRAWAQERLVAKRAATAAGEGDDWGLYENGILVGTAGWFTRDGRAEIGYAIHRDHRGRGLATLAAKLTIERMQAAGHQGPIYACYFHDNPASGAILTKLGFVYVETLESTGAARFEKTPSHVMRLG